MTEFKGQKYSKEYLDHLNSMTYAITKDTKVLLNSKKTVLQDVYFDDIKRILVINTTDNVNIYSVVEKNYIGLKIEKIPFND